MAAEGQVASGEVVKTAILSRTSVVLIAITDHPSGQEQSSCSLSCFA